jgi:DNA-3-methyladenine glycosylase
VSRPRKPARAFFEQSTLTVARELIGMHLVHMDRGVRRAGRIVETEAYLGPHDLAAHSARGRTARTEIMYGPAAHAYVYFIYGMWYCMNVVTRRAGTPQAVLLRALEPLTGTSGHASGPGLLCRALHIDKRLNGVDLLGGVLWLERAPSGAPRPRIARATRIGVDYAGAWAERRWRFFDAQSAEVSTLSAAARTKARASQARLGE